jgi:tetratricopeptide (TPR) repeat protein
MSFTEKSYIPFAIIAIVGLLLYAQTFFFGFTYLDDNSLIVDNTAFLREPSSIINSFKYDVGGPPTISPGGFGFYRPILTLSFIFNYWIGDTHPFIYHVTNVALHILAVELLFLLLCTMMVPRNRAFSFSMIFLVHPIVLAATAWIPGRNDLLLAIMMFSALLYFLVFWRKRSIKYFIVHVVFFMLALFTKETAMVIPLICALFVALVLRERVLSFDQKRVMLVCAWLSGTVVWALMRHYAMFEDNQFVSPIGALRSIFLNMPGALSYLGKFFLPVGFSVYPIRQDLSIISGVVVMCGLIFALVHARGAARRSMVFGLLWFIIVTIPGLINTQPFLKADFAEHRAYVALFGIMFALSHVQPPRIAQKFTPLIIGGVVASLIILNVQRAQAYRNAESFWGDAIRTSPHASAAHNGLGAYYYLTQDLDRAEAEFKRAIELNDAGSEHHYNLGMVYLQKKMYREAEQSFFRELQVNESYIKAYLNLGALYYFIGDQIKAEQVWLAGLKINPDYHDIHNNLAYLYYRQSEISKALVHAKKVLTDGGKLRPQVQEVIEPYLNF